MTTEPLTPDAVRALVAEAEHCARLVPSRHSATRALIERLAAALSASLPREDADLDAIEARENACPGCDGSGSCLAPAHQHGCFADTLGHCNEPEDHPAFSRTVETAEEWGLTYSRNVRGAGPASTAAQYGRTEREHHQDCAGDTGTSHTLPGRLYIVQCEWCPRAFAAPTKREAMILFREHEESMNEPVPPTPEEADRA